MKNFVSGSTYFHRSLNATNQTKSKKMNEEILSNVYLTTESDLKVVGLTKTYNVCYAGRWLFLIHEYNMKSVST